MVFCGTEIMFKINHFQKHCQSKGKMTDMFVSLADGLDVDFVSVSCLAWVSICRFLKVTKKSLHLPNPIFNIQQLVVLAGISFRDKNLFYSCHFRCPVIKKQANSNLGYFTLKVRLLILTFDPMKTLNLILRTQSASQKHHCNTNRKSKIIRNNEALSYFNYYHDLKKSHHP